MRAAQRRVAVRNGAVVAWEADRHKVLPRADVVIEGDRITDVCASAAGRFDDELDAAGMLVVPGFVNIHTHATDTAFTRDYLEESSGPKDFGNLYRILPAVRNATLAEDACAGAAALFVEALLSGTTTIVELGYDRELAGSADLDNAHAVAEIAIGVGLRCYTAPRFRKGYWRGDASGNVAYHDYPDHGRSRMEACIRYCREVDGRHDGRLRAMLAPGQVDTCDEDMLRETRRVARATGLPIQLHAGQSPTEFRRIKATQDVSTIRFLERAGLLGPDLIIGHGMFLAQSSDVGMIPRDELAALSESGTSIGHLPWVKMRQGTLLNSYAKFLHAGVNVALGTDTHPFDMIHEMRMAAIGCKLAEQSQQATTAMQAFELATVNGARALKRSDLGRIAPGCKADLVLVDLGSPRAAGYQDPMKYLVYNGDGNDVHTVLVDGLVVVRGGKPLHADVREIVARMNEAKKRVVSRLQL